MDVNTKLPLVTVFIPSYNHGDFVSFCIESIINQDYKNIELIIIDDGSTDNSVKVIDSYSEQCLNRFVNYTFLTQSNSGLAFSSNKALALSNGEYFCLIASDDAFLPKKITIQVSYLEANEYAAAVFGRCYLIDYEGKVTGETKSDNKNYSFNEIILLEHQLKAPTAMVRKNLIKDVGGYNVNLIIEDWYLWLRLTSSGKYYLAVMPEFFAYYRRHDNNTSNNYRLMFSSADKILEEYKCLDIYDAAYSKLLSVITYEASFHEYAFPFTLWRKNKMLGTKEKSLQLIRILLPNTLLKFLRFIKYGR